MSTLNTFSTSVGRYTHGTRLVQRQHSAIPILIISTKLTIHQYRYSLATEYYQVNLEKESQKILALLKPEKAALTELV